jgi:hypothetical protein
VVVKVCVPVVFQLLLVSLAHICQQITTWTVEFKVLVTLLQAVVGEPVQAVQVSLTHTPVLFVPNMNPLKATLSVHLTLNKHGCPALVVFVPTFE